MIYNFPSLAFKNRKLIESSFFVGCFHCLKIYKKEEIVQYTDKEQTAICPYCKIDAIIGDNCGFDLNENILQKANKYWCCKI